MTFVYIKFFLLTLVYFICVHDSLYVYAGYYQTKAASNPGAGDVLMGFLGSVILSFAFSMFKQRKVRSHTELYVLLLLDGSEWHY